METKFDIYTYELWIDDKDILMFTDDAYKEYNEKGKYYNECTKYIDEIIKKTFIGRTNSQGKPYDKKDMFFKKVEINTTLIPKYKVGTFVKRKIRTNENIYVILNVCLTKNGIEYEIKMENLIKDQVKGHSDTVKESDIEETIDIKTI